MAFEVVAVAMVEVASEGVDLAAAAVVEVVRVVAA